MVHTEFLRTSRRTHDLVGCVVEGGGVDVRTGIEVIHLHTVHAQEDLVAHHVQVVEEFLGDHLALGAAYVGVLP